MALQTFGTYSLKICSTLMSHYAYKHLITFLLILQDSENTPSGMGSPSQNEIMDENISLSRTPSMITRSRPSSFREHF